MRKYRLGLHAPEPATVALKLNDYFDHQSVLPKIPDNFGHANAITDWGMLGNGPDTNPGDIPVGDCAFAGPEHIIVGWRAAAKKPPVPFTYASTIEMYSKVTGYDPTQNQPDGSNPTDQGGDMSAIAEYWQTTGFTAVAALIIGVAAAHSTRAAVFTAGISALLAGAVSMALGEYVSVSTQRDAEKGLVKARQMRAQDMVRPSLAAMSSAVAFTIGAAIPLVAMLASPIEQRVTITFAAVLAALVLTGVVSARQGDTPVLRPTVRVVCGGAAAMAITYLIGYVIA